MKSARGAALAYPILRSPRFPVELSPAASRWVPHISRFLRDVGGKFRVTRRSRVGLPPLGNCSALGGVPAHLLLSHISQKTRDMGHPPISGRDNVAEGILEFLGSHSLFSP